jgi:hypothetical protein
MAEESYLNGLEFDHIWLDLETNPETNPGIKEPFLLLIEKKTGNVFTLLVYLKSLLDSNYSRKVSHLMNREVNIPTAVAIPEEKQKLIHWKWAEESSSELKDYLKKHVFEEKRVESPTGHLMLVVLPVAYVALVRYEDAQCKPLTLAFHRAMRHSTYWPWLPGMDKKEELVRRLDELSGFDANNVDQKLFHGPVDFIETATKFMFAFPSEAEKDKYKKGRNQNCPFERDEENSIHALLESTQVGPHGGGPPPQEGLQAPTAIGLNLAAGTVANGNDRSLINVLRGEVEKLREEVKDLRDQVENWLKPALFVLSQAQSNEIPKIEIERTIVRYVRRLFKAPEPGVPTSGNLPLEPVWQGAEECPLLYHDFYDDLPPNVQMSFRNMLEDNGAGPEENEEVTEQFCSLDISGNASENASTRQEDLGNSGSTADSPQALLPPDTNAYYPVQSLIINGREQGMGQVSQSDSK